MNRSFSVSWIYSRSRQIDASGDTSKPANRIGRTTPLYPVMVGEGKKEFAMVGGAEIHCEDLSGGYGNARMRRSADSAAGKDETAARAVRPRCACSIESQKANAFAAVAEGEYEEACAAVTAGLRIATMGPEP
jgi:hypothetical protein